MMKSITPVISVILLILLTIVASASAYFFINSNIVDLESQGNLENAPFTDSSFLRIVSATGSKAIVLNSGNSAITDMIVFVNGELLNFTLDPPIQPGEAREINYTAQVAGEDLEVTVLYGKGKEETYKSLASKNTLAAGFTDSGDGEPSGCLIDDDCNDGNPCTADTCDVESGTCSNDFTMQPLQEITSCGVTLSDSCTYYNITMDITPDIGQNCITVNASNIIIDGQTLYSVTFNTGSEYGLFINPFLKNITIKGLYIYSDKGIYAKNIQDLSLEELSIETVSNDEIYIENATGINVYYSSTYAAMTLLNVNNSVMTNPQASLFNCTNCYNNTFYDLSLNTVGLFDYSFILKNSENNNFLTWDFPAIMNGGNKMLINNSDNNHFGEISTEMLECNFEYCLSIENSDNNIFSQPVVLDSDPLGLGTNLFLLNSNNNYFDSVSGFYNYYCVEVIESSNNYFNALDCYYSTDGISILSSDNPNNISSNNSFISSLMTDISGFGIYSYIASNNTIKNVAFSGITPPLVAVYLENTNQSSLTDIQILGQSTECVAVIDSNNNYFEDFIFNMDSCSEYVARLSASSDNYLANFSVDIGATGMAGLSIEDGSSRNSFINMGSYSRDYPIQLGTDCDSNYLKNFDIIASNGFAPSINVIASADYNIFEDFYVSSAWMVNAFEIYSNHNRIYGGNLCDNDYDYYDIYNEGTNNTGINNTCNSIYNYNDQSTTGCTYACYASEYICDDSYDNDKDGDADCADDDCIGDPNCPTEICDDELDNDGDLLIDCTDHDDCDGQMGIGGICSSYETSYCDDLFDNDADGDVDCDDSVDCLDDPVCSCGDAICDYGEECMADCYYEEYCDDGADNNENGMTDCTDSADCASFPPCCTDDGMACMDNSECCSSYCDIGGTDTCQPM